MNIQDRLHVCGCHSSNVCPVNVAHSNAWTSRIDYICVWLCESGYHSSSTYPGVMQLQSSIMNIQDRLHVCVVVILLMYVHFIQTQFCTWTSMKDCMWLSFLWYITSLLVTVQYRNIQDRLEQSVLFLLVHTLTDRALQWIQATGLFKD